VGLEQEAFLPEVIGADCSAGGQDTSCSTKLQHEQRISETTNSFDEQDGSNISDMLEQCIRDTTDLITESSCQEDSRFREHASVSEDEDSFVHGQEVIVSDTADPSKVSA
jgi:hypothetical protein